MKKIVCEICGSSNIVKKEGVFVCQDCDVKYTADEVKKLLVEVGGASSDDPSTPTAETPAPTTSSDELTGASKDADRSVSFSQGSTANSNTAPAETTSSSVPSSPTDSAVSKQPNALDSRYFLNNLENARRARKTEEWSEVEKYYNLIEQVDPHNIEAVFYSIYSRVMAAFNSTKKRERVELITILANTFNVLANYYNISQSKEMQDLFAKISEDVIQLSKVEPCKNLRYDIFFDGEIIGQKNKLEQSFVDLLVTVLAKDQQVSYGKLLITHCQRLIKSGLCKDDQKSLLKIRINNALKLIRQSEPNYSVYIEEEQAPKSIGPKGCLIGGVVGILIIIVICLINGV